MIYTLQNLSVLGLCLRIHDSGLFAWISQTALSQTYFIIAAIQDGPSLHIEEPQPTPCQKAHCYFFVVHISHCDEIFISQYIGTPVTDVITSSHLDKNVQFLAGPFNDQTGPILFPSYPSTHIYVHVKTEAI